MKLKTAKVQTWNSHKLSGGLGYWVRFPCFRPWLDWRGHFELAGYDVTQARHLYLHLPSRPYQVNWHPFFLLRWGREGFQKSAASLCKALRRSLRVTHYALGWLKWVPLSKWCSLQEDVRAECPMAMGLTLWQIAYGNRGLVLDAGGSGQVVGLYVWNLFLWRRLL